MVPCHQAERGDEVPLTNIGLAKLIQTVDDQLRTARDTTKNNLILGLVECELGLTVEVTNEGGTRTPGF